MQPSNSRMINSIEIRFATADDCEQLSKLIAAVIKNITYYNDLAKVNEVEKFNVHHLQEKIKADRLSVIIATIENEIAGFCLSRFDDYTIWLEWFGIAENHRGKGISHLLLNELDTTILPRECHKIWCDCRTSNEASVHILASHGYNQLITIANHWYNHDFILWQKFI